MFIQSIRLNNILLIHLRQLQFLIYYLFSIFCGFKKQFQQIYYGSFHVKLYFFHS